MEELQVIQKYENIFIQAGKLASKLRKDICIRKKYNTGINDMDIVTNADLVVQEFILQSIVESKLRNCEVVAEEDTPTKCKFATSSDWVITVDPIDGTALYASGKKMYSVIVTLHNKKRPIYTFDYFPEVEWGVKIIGDKCTHIGTKPQIDHNEVVPKTIVYSSYGTQVNLRENMPSLYKQLSIKGYIFRQKREISDETGSAALFLSEVVDGYYMESGSAVDCLAGLHYGLANGYVVYQNIDLTKTVRNKHHVGNEQYLGNYLVIKNY